MYASGKAVRPTVKKNLGEYRIHFVVADKMARERIQRIDKVYSTVG
jgi:hypothetical protein